MTDDFLKREFERIDAWAFANKVAILFSRRQREFVNSNAPSAPPTLPKPPEGASLSQLMEHCRQDDGSFVQDSLAWLSRDRG